MKRMLIAVIAALPLWPLASVVSAQAPAPLPPAGPLAPTPSAPTVSSTVQQYLLNPHGEVDGLLLIDGTSVRFPPHLGAALTSTVKPGDVVTVIGFAGLATPQGRGMKALTITNATTGHTVVDQPPATPPLPPHQRGLYQAPLTVSGTVMRYLVNPRGDVDGLVLASGEQVKFRPHQGPRVMGLVGTAGGMITVSGFGTRNAFGTVVDADSITVGNQTFALRRRR